MTRLVIPPKDPVHVTPQSSHSGPPDQYTGMLTLAIPTNTENDPEMVGKAVLT